ncbi:MAG: DoxX family membrane protein [Bryobacterales bacterium]|nr:DoxX family membrane protein [Bryobacterales bacterium]
MAVNAELDVREDALAEPLPAWKRTGSHIAAVLLAVVFLASGGYKMLMPLDAAERLTQVLIPGNLSVAAAVVLAVTEVFAAVMLLIPRYRRFGAAIMLAMLVAFCIYVGVNFDRLQGEDCGCFPLVKRAVGPVFFITNFVMIALAVLAGLWASRASRWLLPQPLRTSIAVFALLSVLSVGSATWASARESGLEAPATLRVNGEVMQLAEAPTFLYLYDPECAHCLQSAKMMATWNWGTTRVIAVPTVNPDWGQILLDDSGFKAELAKDPEDVKALRGIFEFANPPYGVALKRGRARITVRYAEFTPELEGKLRAEGFLAH